MLISEYLECVEKDVHEMRSQHHRRKQQHHKSMQNANHSFLRYPLDRKKIVGIIEVSPPVPFCASGEIGKRARLRPRYAEMLTAGSTPALRTIPRPSGRFHAGVAERHTQPAQTR